MKINKFIFISVTRPEVGPLSGWVFFKDKKI